MEKPERKIPVVSHYNRLIFGVIKLCASLSLSFLESNNHI